MHKPEIPFGDPDVVLAAAARASAVRVAAPGIFLSEAALSNRARQIIASETTTPKSVVGLALALAQMKADPTVSAERQGAAGQLGAAIRADVEAAAEEIANGVSGGGLLR